MTDQTTAAPELTLERINTPPAQTWNYLRTNDITITVPDEVPPADAAAAVAQGADYWPLRLTDYAGTLELETIPRAFSVGEIEIDTMQGRHPGGCVIFRLTAKPLGNPNFHKGGFWKEP